MTNPNVDRVNDTVRRFPRTLDEAFPKDHMHEWLEYHRAPRGTFWDYALMFVAFVLLCALAYQVFTA